MVVEIIDARDGSAPEQFRSAIGRAGELGTAALVSGVGEQPQFSAFDKQVSVFA